MAKTIGECRLNSYNLFFERPLWQYFSSDMRKVLVMGEGMQAEEVFKISLIAGQNMGKALSVDLFSNNAEEFGKKIFDENGSFPALSKFVNNKNTTVRFKNCDFSLIEFNNYDYIIIADDNEQTNLEIVNCILERFSFKSKTLIAVYCDSKNVVSSGTNNIEIFAFGNQNVDSFKKSELMRLAKNINFAYAMDNNMNTTCEEADAGFIKSFETEFCASENMFHGADYNADSSIACAMHIPCKLELCQRFGECNDPEKTLSESILHKNNLYHNLVELEHKRWNVFMALRGFREPTLDECRKYLHTKNNDHKNKEKLLHMCMVDFDKLDKISKLSAELASAKSKDIIADKEDIFSKLTGANLEEQNLMLAIEKLFNNDTNSVKLYEDSLNSVKGIITDDRIKYIKSKLSPVVTRNKAIDFKGIDEQLINYLPFCMWYRKKYKKVITISDGTALKDVIIPTIFCSNDLQFLGPKLKSNHEYSKTLSRYFKSRFGESSTHNLDIKNIDEDNLVEFLSEEIKKECIDEILINISSKQNIAIIVAIGKLIAKYPEIAVVSYDTDVNVLNGNKSISAGIDNKYFTAEEVIRLTGGEPTNEYNRVLTWKQRRDIGDFFSKYYKFNSYKVINSNGEEKTNYFNTWILMNDILKSAMSSKKLKINGKYQKTNCKNIQYGELNFEKSFYKESGIEKVLKKCKEKNIIRNLQVIKRGTDIDVSFEYLEAEEEMFNTFEKFSKKELSKDEKNKYNRIVFNNDGINTYSLHIYNPINNSGNLVRLYSDNEHKVIKKIKEQFMLDLERCNFIEILSKENLQDLNFIVKDEFIRWLLMTQGAVFEEVLLHQLYQYGQFDDLKLGVNFSWNQEIRDFDRSVQKKIDALSCDEFGYQFFQKCVDDVKNDNKKNMFDGIENEIDIIAVKKMNSYFISCKTNKKHENNWLYEIKSISNHFDATPIMATAHLYKESERCEFVNRAYQMNISLIGMETIYNRNKLEIALEDVLGGKIINPSINERGEYIYEL